MTPLQSFIFLGVTVAFLWVLWLVLNLVFDLLDYWHDSLRAKAASANKERERSRF